jgi:hypothetical protein
MLLFTPDGKFVLSNREKYVSAGIVFCILAILFLLVFGHTLPNIKPGNQFFAAVIFLMLTLPISRFEHWPAIKKRLFYAMYTISLVVLACVAVALVLMIHSHNTAYTIVVAYVVCMGLYTWLFQLTGAQ